jgi:molecular chaperone DnaJ
MPNVSGRGRGDLYVIARVTVPKKLSRDQKRAVEELARVLPPDKLDGDAADGDKPFFERVKDIFG